jgi:DNA-binding XRE family transcriptional regulator
MAIDSPFARRLITARAAKGLSQVELAAAAGVAPAQLSRYERGATIPRPQICAKLAKALDVSTQWLLIGEGDGPNHDQNTRSFSVELSPHTYDVLIKKAEAENITVDELLKRQFVDQLTDLAEHLIKKGSKPGFDDRLRAVEDALTQLKKGKKQ